MFQGSHLGVDIDMALFSSNPFVGAFRSQREREKMLQQQSPRALARAAEMEAAQSPPKGGGMMVGPDSGYGALKNRDSVYAFSGGSSPWTMEQYIDPSRGGAISSRPVLRKPVPTGDRPKYAGEMLKNTPVLVPPQFWGKQEYRGLWDKPNAIRAPEKFVRGKGTSDRDRKDAFYSEVTGQPMAFLGEGGYGGFGKNAKDGDGNPLARYSPSVAKHRAERGQNPYGPESTGKFAPRTGQRGPAIDPWKQREMISGVPQSPEDSMGMVGGPLSFTGFGQMAGMAPQPLARMVPQSSTAPAFSPFGGDGGFGSPYGFGGSFFPFY